MKKYQAGGKRGARGLFFLDLACPWGGGGKSPARRRGGAVRLANYIHTAVY
jgi:hypothetical protein